MSITMCGFFCTLEARGKPRGNANHSDPTSVPRTLEAPPTNSSPCQNRWFARSRSTDKSSGYGVSNLISSNKTPSTRRELASFCGSIRRPATATSARDSRSAVTGSAHCYLSEVNGQKLRKVGDSTHRNPLVRRIPARRGRRSG